MAGSITLGGLADNLLAGEVVIGPSTVGGKAAVSEIITIELAANTDTAIKVPAEAVAFALFFATASSAQEVKLGTNTVATSTGFPIASQGFMAACLQSGTTELKFKSATPPAAFQLVFI